MKLEKGNHSNRMVKVSCKIGIIRALDGNPHNSGVGEALSRSFPWRKRLCAGVLPPHLEPQLLEACAYRHRLCVESVPL